jgi:hypothetical protein
VDEPTALAPSPDFDAVVAERSRLSRNHLLYVRIEVGRRLFSAFTHDAPALYRATHRQKEGSFRASLAEKADALADLGLNEALLRQALRTFFVVKDLPRALVAQLVTSHVVQLTAVADEQTRAMLARATVDHRWSGRALQSAIEAVHNGQWPDADPSAPGLQPEGLPAAEPGPEGPKPHPGRVVTRSERRAEDLGALVGQWEAVPVEKLTKAQAARVRAAVEALERRGAEVGARLPG